MFGFKGTGHELQKTWNSAYYGARYLKHLLIRYEGRVCDSISAFNMGKVKRFESGMYRNRKYVKRVLSRMEKFGGSLDKEQKAFCAEGVQG